MPSFQGGRERSKMPSKKPSQPLPTTRLNRLVRHSCKCHQVAPSSRAARATRLTITIPTSRRRRRRRRRRYTRNRRRRRFRRLLARQHGLNIRIPRVFFHGPTGQRRVPSSYKVVFPPTRLRDQNIVVEPPVRSGEIMRMRIKLEVAFVAAKKLIVRCP